MALTESTHLGQAQHLIGALIAHGLLQKNLPEEQYLNLWDVVGKHVKVICGEAEREATAPLLARIEELETEVEYLAGMLGTQSRRSAAMTAQVEQAAQPVAEVSEVCGAGPNDVGIRWRGGIVATGTKLYTAPPKAVRPRAVPLTDHGAFSLIDSMGWSLDDAEKDDMLKLLRATEASHGIITPATVEKGKQ